MVLQGRYLKMGSTCFIDLDNKKWLSYTQILVSEYAKTKKESFFVGFICSNTNLIFKTEPKNLRYYDVEKNQFFNLFSDKKGIKDVFKMKNLTDDSNSENSINFTENHGKIHLFIERVSSSRQDN